MIPFLDLKKVNQPYSVEIEAAVKRVLNSGWYINGQEKERFEKNFANFIGSAYSIGVANGLDALRIIIRAYIELGLFKKGDEILVPANTFIASIIAITDNGLIPVLIEANKDSLQIDENEIEKSINSKTKAIMLVHLYGQSSFTKKIIKLSNKFNLKIIEDNAQAQSVYSVAKCSQLTLGNGGPISKLPLSQTVFGYTLAYLSYFIGVNNLQNQNIATYILFPVVIVADMFWSSTNRCSSPKYLLTSLIIGGLLGALWAMVIDSTGVPGLAYFSGIANKDVCSQPTKSLYRCRAVNGAKNPA